MPNSKKIILIENQYSQFKQIYQHLIQAGFTVYPSDKLEDFKNFIDIIKIFLNKRYGGIEEGSRRSIVFNEILNIIKNNFKPSLFIIDYILIGHHEGQTGIYLGQMLRKSKITEPILFLSKAARNNNDILFNLGKELEPRDWCDKGYAGEDILDEEYFTNHVLVKINEMIKKVDDHYFNIINGILNSGKFDFDDNIKVEALSYLKNIVVTGIISDHEKSVLDKQDLDTEESRKKFFNLLKSKQ